MPQIHQNVQPHFPMNETQLKGCNDRVKSLLTDHFLWHIILDCMPEGAQDLHHYSLTLGSE